MTIYPIMNPCPEIWDNHVLSLENKNMLIKSIHEILKTKHNDKSNSVYVMIYTHQTQLQAKALPGAFGISKLLSIKPLQCLLNVTPMKLAPSAQ